jgi:hypothetical protein
MFGTCNGFIQVVNICLVMLAMMYLHCLRINMWFQCIVRIGKGG